MRLQLFLFILIPTLTFAQQKPNIIYIMSDDHDADAISTYSKKLIHTPNIDRLANEGIKFTNAFVGNSICSPARATLLTGQHSHKNGIKDNQTRFDSSRSTLPKLLQPSGYQTAVIGKWHLHSHPTGFDYWKVLPGQGLYVNPNFIEMTGAVFLRFRITNLTPPKQRLPLIFSRWNILAQKSFKKVKPASSRPANRPRRGRRSSDRPA